MNSKSYKTNEEEVKKEFDYFTNLKQKADAPFVEAARRAMEIEELSKNNDTEEER